jgi:hypothetical protein
MPYPYTFPVVSPGEEITAEKTNQMHQAHVDNNKPDSIDDLSADVTQMRLVEDPGNDGSESLATTLAGEIKRLRNEIKALKDFVSDPDPQYWYSNLDTNNSAWVSFQPNLFLFENGIV